VRHEHIVSRGGVFQTSSGAHSPSGEPLKRSFRFSFLPSLFGETSCRGRIRPAGSLFVVFGLGENALGRQLFEKAPDAGQFYFGSLGRVVIADR
jgi:hypothetical protein